jgi:general secretion pathway protein D
MSRAASTLLALLALLTSGGAAAQRPVLGPDGRVNLDYRNAELPVVIDHIADLTGKNFLYDDRVRGQVTLVSPTPMTLDQAYRVFESILQVKGFTTVPGPGGVLKIVPIRTAKESAIETVPGMRQVPNRDLYITRLIPLQYVKADAISNTLRPLVSGDANLVAYAPTNTIILTDTAANVRRLLTIIAEIDIETYEDQIRVIPIEFADAGALTRHLETIYGSQAAAPVRRAPARARQARQAQAQAPVQAFGEAGQARFITDERTNSIIVIAPLATLSQVTNLIKLLDYRRKGSGRIHVVRLQNADAEEMSETLSRLAESAAGAAAAARGAGVPETAAAAVAELAGGIRITADAPTNSLIVQATSEGFTAVQDVIEALDVRRPQVMVEALIMEVDVTDASTLGAGFLYQTVLGDDTRLLTGSATGVSPLPPGGIAEPNGPGLPDFTSAVLGRLIEVMDSEGNLVTVPVIQGIITARGSDDDTNIISAPTILTADNEEAQIVVGQNIPIVTSQVEAATGAPTLSTSQNVERQDVGVTLRVTPQISEGDTVRLNIFQEISEVIPASIGSELGVSLTQRTVENTVYVQDGEAVMIGGIIQETQSQTVNKVPWLGDIPILGWAFKGTSDNTRKVNLIVILTPHIVRDPGDLEQLTVANRARFRSEAGDSLDRTEEDKEQRAKALAAGVPLPRDRNPVRRELEDHEEVYPVEKLPQLREEQEQRQKERREELEALEEAPEGEYRVQVQWFQEPSAAVELLQKLMARGYDGTVLSQREGDSVLHGVELGPFPTEVRAQHVARELEVDMGIDARVIVEP